MKLFVDDERQPPDGTWNVVRSAELALAFLQASIFQVELLSLDHDLGEPKDTNNGHRIACWLEEQVFRNGLTPPPVLQVHSGNSVGATNILAAFNSIARFCRDNGMKVPEVRRILPGD
jgi:hypothetical protein